MTQAFQGPTGESTGLFFPPALSLQDVSGRPRLDVGSQNAQACIGHLAGHVRKAFTAAIKELCRLPT